MPSGLPEDDPFVRDLEDISCSTSFLLKRAVEALRWGRERRAGDILYHALHVAPDDPDVQIALADYCRSGALKALNSGRRDLARSIIGESLKHAEAAVRLAPGYPSAWVEKGAALILMQKYEEAIAALRKALELDPAVTDARRRLALALAETGKFDEARRECMRALRADPANVSVLDTLGVILARQGNWEEALDAWRRSARTDPDSLIPVYNSIRALIHLGRIPDARETLQALARRFPDFPGLPALKQEVEGAAAQARKQ